MYFQNLFSGSRVATGSITYPRRAIVRITVRETASHWGYGACGTGGETGNASSVAKATGVITTQR